MKPLMERIKNLKYITSPSIEFKTAIKELTNSPIYKNLIISEDSKTFWHCCLSKRKQKIFRSYFQKIEIVGE